MKELLMMIGADPRRSTRPAEAIRIGAGIGAWGKVRVNVYLQGPATACLQDFAEELEGGALLVQYLPMIQAHGGTVFVEGNGSMPGPARVQQGVRPLTPAGLREVLQRSDYSMNFDAEIPSYLATFRLPNEGADYDTLLREIFASERVHVW